MMNAKQILITRAELHAMVWTEPRSRLAGKWGISDVAIGKLCVRENIPAPPPGYWARKAAGRKVSSTTLPTRLPGQREVMQLRAVPHHTRCNPEDDPDAEILPPMYVETEDEVVGSAFRRLGTFRAKRDLSAPHRGLQGVLKSETRRAEKWKEHNWSFDKPYFSEPMFQRQLRIFSSIFFILDAINADCEVAARSTWIQGLGYVHHLVAGVFLGSTGVRLQFLEPENPKGSSELQRSSVTTLRIGSGSKAVDVPDDPTDRIERRLADITRAILVQAETEMRAADFWMYEMKLQHQIEVREQIAERKRQEEAMRIAAEKARRQAIRQEIDDAAANLRRARDIRSLVEAMAAHPDWVGEGRPHYLTWSAMALGEADSIDPMLQPIGQCFSAWKPDAER